MVDSRKLCFVVLGFGKKTDFESRRTLDLDTTYGAIIKPATDKAGLRCIRADEVMHSGFLPGPTSSFLVVAIEWLCLFTQTLPFDTSPLSLSPPCAD